jgi:opacity protein-like surface antigen
MKRLILALAPFALAAAFIPASAAAPIAVASGGGNGTFDGSTAGSHFGFGVVYGTAVSGHFECNMAGNATFGGLHLMAVEGQTNVGTANVTAGTASFSGQGTLHIDSQKMAVNFYVNVKEGGPGSGTLQLTVTTRTGAPVAAFPPETVMTGQISVH